MKRGDDWVEFSFSYQDGAFSGYAGTKDHELEYIETLKKTTEKTMKPFSFLIDGKI